MMKASYPELYRRRLIPSECVHLKDDTILHYDDEHLVTSWSALHPKPDLDHGYSCCFLKEGYKVSEFIDHDGNLMYIYCDIIESSYDEASNSLIITDLLADVIIYPDGLVKVVDLEELSTALDERSITVEELKAALCSLSRLLDIIYSKRLNTLTDVIAAYK